MIHFIISNRRRRSCVAGLRIRAACFRTSRPISGCLDRALVEADHRPVGIGRLGIEIEHIFHAGDIFAIDLWNAPHVLPPRLEAFSASRRRAVSPGRLS